MDFTLTSNSCDRLNKSLFELSALTLSVGSHFLSLALFVSSPRVSVCLRELLVKIILSIRHSVSSEKRVENTMCRIVYLTNFDMFHLKI